MVLEGTMKNTIILVRKKRVILLLFCAGNRTEKGYLPKRDLKKGKGMERERERDKKKKQKGEGNGNGKEKRKEKEKY